MTRMLVEDAVERTVTVLFLCDDFMLVLCLSGNDPDTKSRLSHWLSTTIRAAHSHHVA